MNHSRLLTQIPNVSTVRSSTNMIHSNEKKDKSKTNTINDSLHMNYAGKIKHFPPGNKEWFNSIYAYNKEAIKILPSMDKIVSKLIKAYFNSYSRRLENRVKKARSRRYRIRRVRLSTNRILVSRAELKHTNDKVIITVYVYNNEKKIFYNKIKNIPTIDQAGRLLRGWTIKEQINFIASKINKYINRQWTSKNIDNFLSCNPSLKRINKLIPENATINQVYSFFSSKFREGSFFSEFPKSMFLTINRSKTKTKNTGKAKDNSKGLYKEKETMQTKINAEMDRRREFINTRLPNINHFLLKRLSKNALGLISRMQFQKKGLYSFINNNGLALDKIVHMSKLSVYEIKYIEDLVSKVLRKEIISIYFRQLIGFNKFKFEKQYVSSLTGEIEKIYGKKAEFNFVNLKYLFLSGSIFSTTLLAKIRNRKNKLLKVMKDSLLMFNLPPVNRQAIYDEIYNRKMVVQNLAITNTIIKPHLNHTVLIDNEKVNNLKYHHNIDVLDKFLSNIIPRSYSDFIDKTTSEIKHYAHKLVKVINLLKNKSVTGVRIEVAGRLTKRNTAARSLFKLRYKGNIKNTDSSDKGLSAVMLRGNAKSNLEYSSLKSKIRIGSYGLKGWVSSG